MYLYKEHCGLPLYFTITPGQESDYKQAINLIQHGTRAHIIADRDYDADAIITYIQSYGKTAIIPSPAHRIQQRPINVDTA